MSLPDAIFTARFILLTHELGAHNFSSLSFFDKILEDVSPIVFSCTANEAKCYGADRGWAWLESEDARGGWNRRRGDGAGIGGGARGLKSEKVRGVGAGIGGRA